MCFNNVYGELRFINRLLFALRRIFKKRRYRGQSLIEYFYNFGELRENDTGDEAEVNLV